MSDSHSPVGTSRSSRATSLSATGREARPGRLSFLGGVMSKETSAALPAVSGSYRGFLSGPTGAPQRLDLRVDVDSRIDQGSVLNRVSGDLFRVDKVNVPGKAPKQTEIYQESWILEQPVVKTEGGAVSIS